MIAHENPRSAPLATVRDSATGTVMSAPDVAGVLLRSPDDPQHRDDVLAGQLARAVDRRRGPGGLPPRPMLARVKLTGGAASATATSIGNGHSFAKHKHEFPVTTTAELVTIVEGVILSPTAQFKDLARGRSAYYDAAANVVVVVNPATADKGTVFKPDDRQIYYDGLV